MSLRAKVEYLAERSERPIYYASSAGRNAAHEIDQNMSIVAIEVNDAREREENDSRDEFGMHPSGFDLLDFPSKVSSFLDQQQLESIYETEIENFLKSVTGCYRVHIFDHTVRASDPRITRAKKYPRARLTGAQRLHLEFRICSPA